MSTACRDSIPQPPRDPIRVAGDLVCRGDKLSIEAANAIKRLVESSWRPMRTAPRDGREVLLVVESRAGIPGKMLVGHYMPGGHCIEDHPAIDEGWYFWNGCRFDRASKPLAWMPLPEGFEGGGE